MITITPIDFVGRFETHISEFSETKMQSYIDDKAIIIVNELMGVDLFNLWNGSALPIYEALTNPFIMQDNCGNIYESKGIKEMLLGFIYFFYHRDIMTQQSINGAVVNANENSDKATFENSMIWKRYNDSVVTYNAIQRYIEQNKVDYPTYKGIPSAGVIIPYF